MWTQGGNLWNDRDPEQLGMAAEVLCLRGRHDSGGATWG